MRLLTIVILLFIIACQQCTTNSELRKLNVEQQVIQPPQVIQQQPQIFQFDTLKYISE